MTGLATAYDQLGRPDDARALRRELLEHAIRQARSPGANASTLNEVAWDLLTHADEQLQDPEVALELAVRANDASGGDQPHILDTLALAQHMTGDTAAAIETQRRAIELLGEDAPGRADYVESLRGYEESLAGEGMGS